VPLNLPVNAGFNVSGEAKIEKSVDLELAQNHNQVERII
jgi:hypothetical protein